MFLALLILRNQLQMRCTNITCRKSKHQKEILHLLEATSKGWSWCNDDVKDVSKKQWKNPPYKKNKEDFSKKNTLIKENSSLIKVEFLN